MGSVYQNTTGKPMWVYICYFPANSQNIYVYCDTSSSPSTQVCWQQSSASAQAMEFSFIALPNYYYKLYTTGGALYTWTEYY